MSTTPNYASWKNQSCAKWNEAHREERLAYIREYSRKHRAELSAKTAEWKRSFKGRDPGGYKHFCWKTHLWQHFRMTPEDYDAMQAAQGGGCAICGAGGSDTTHSGRLYVDHDHVTGRVRGLLCMRCNSGVGQFRENTGVMRKAIAYVEKHKRPV